MSRCYLVYDLDLSLDLVTFIDLRGELDEIRVVLDESSILILNAQRLRGDVA
jgi:hypothetical protein